VTNAEMSKVFERIAVMLELEGANVFRVRAYREAARVIAASGESMTSLAETPGALEALQGIGKDLAQKIRDLANTGATEIYRELQKKFPLSLVELTELQGLGPKRVRTLFETLGIRDRDGLEKAAKAQKLRELPGFGEKVEQNVLKAIATASQWSGRMLLASAWPLAMEIADSVRRVKGITQLELAGSFRRRKETVGDLDLLVCGGDPEAVMEAFVTHRSVAEVLGRGETKSSVRLGSGIQVDLRVVPEASFGAAMLYFTGSKEHNIELRKIAIDKGMSLNEYGLTRGEKVVASRTEEDVYRALGLRWIPPELRESHGEIDLARKGELPVLIELEDLRADLHMHTTRTDGRDSIAAMVKGAIDRGYEYIAITEHSKSLPMTFGFDAGRVRQSVGEIDAARREFPGIRILHGLECDILADGELDLDDETLSLLDWVLIAIHSRFEMDPKAATERVLRAIANPFVNAFAHPTGRQIGSRASMPFDVERMTEEAAKRGVLMEINASPERLDLSDNNARLARTKGCSFVIDTDAHAVAHLDNLRYGVFQARRAGLTKQDVWNTRGWEPFSKMIEKKRAGAGPAVAVAPVAPAAKAAKAAAKAALKPAPKASKPAKSPAPKKTAMRRSGSPKRRG
jgi:DNA polymerase (family 10)